MLTENFKGTIFPFEQTQRIEKEEHGTSRVYRNIIHVCINIQRKKERERGTRMLKYHADRSRVLLITRQNEAFGILCGGWNRDSLGRCQSPRDTRLVLLFDRVQRAGENRHLLHPRQCPHGDLKFTRDFLFSSIKLQSRYSQREEIR